MLRRFGFGGSGAAGASCATASRSAANGTIGTWNLLQRVHASRPRADRRRDAADILRAEGDARSRRRFASGPHLEPSSERRSFPLLYVLCTWSRGSSPTQAPIRRLARDRSCELS